MSGSSASGPGSPAVDQPVMGSAPAACREAVTADPAARDWPLIAQLEDWETGLAQRWAGHSRVRTALYEFFRFGVKQAWACLFGGLMCALLLATIAIWGVEGRRLPPSSADPVAPQGPPASFRKTLVEMLADTAARRFTAWAPHPGCR